MYKKNEKLMKEFVYDFSVLGGATGAINLVAIDPIADLLPAGFVVDNVSLYTETAIASTGTPTITVGNTTDPDGYFVDIFAAASAANSSIHVGQLAGALVWDTTEDAIKGYRISSTAADQNVAFTIGTAPLSAGKVRVTIEGHMPSSSDGHVDQ